MPQRVGRLLGRPPTIQRWYCLPPSQADQPTNCTSLMTSSQGTTSSALAIYNFIVKEKLSRRRLSQVTGERKNSATKQETI